MGNRSSNIRRSYALASSQTQHVICRIVYFYHRLCFYDDLKRSSILYIAYPNCVNLYQTTKITGLAQTLDG